MQQVSVFATDKLRQKLAEEGNANELAKTYDGSYSDLPSMNNSKKWDFRAMNSARIISGKMDPNTQARIKTVAELMDRSKKTLDFGVGPGDILAYLMSKGCKIDYTGIDIAQNFIDRMVKLFPEHKFFCQNIEDVESSSYQQVLALEVFEHIDIPSLKNIYQHIWRMLSDKGNLIISVPIYEKLEDITLCCSQCGSLENAAGHVRAFTPHLVFAELELAGFKVVTYKYVWAQSANWIKGILRRFLRPILKQNPVTIVVKAEKTSLPSRFPAYRGSKEG